jgi:gamma-glutamyl phosphate reductase
MEDMEFLKAMLAEMNANMKSILEKMDADLEERRAGTKDIQAKTKALRDQRMEANMDALQKEMQVDREARKTMDSKANPEEMESEADHREVPTEEVTVKFSGTTKKRHGLASSVASSCRATRRAKGTDPRRL